jgi:hypothetical protein
MALAAGWSVPYDGELMRRLLALLLVASGVAAAPERTCNIPVFRYALERWPASPYEVVAYHRGPLSDDGKAALNALRGIGANVAVDRIDVSEPIPPKWKELLDKSKLEVPCMVAIFPGTEIVAWAGPLTADAAKKLTDSPVRREVAKRLLEGDSAVWLMVDSGDPAKDAAAVGTLETELKRLTQSMKLPPHAPDDPPLLSDVPVKIAFSVLRVAKNDPAETALTTMLHNSETGLEGPVVYPIFGRGRALWAMAAKGLTPDNIAEAAAFLIGACSCEAKDLNPGLDLLFAADWEQGLRAAPPPVPVPPPLLKPRAPEADPAPASNTPEKSSAFLWGALLVAGLAVAVTGRRLLAKPAKSP